jgi:hypothetical protein
METFDVECKKAGHASCCATGTKKSTNESAAEVRSGGLGGNTCNEY